MYALFTYSIYTVVNFISLTPFNNFFAVLCDFTSYSRRLKKVDIVVAYRFRSTAVLRPFNFRSTPVLFAYSAY